MTGAEKILKWYKDYVKINGVYPLIGEIESQLEMAVEEENIQSSTFDVIFEERLKREMEDSDIDLDSHSMDFD